MTIELTADEAEIVAQALDMAAGEHDAENKLVSRKLGFHSKAADTCRDIAHRLRAPRPPHPANSF